MAVCLICKSSLDVGETVCVTRGINTIIEASVKRQDGLHDKINKLETLTLHSSCRRDYTRPSSIQKALTSRSPNTLPINSPAPCLRSSINTFDFKKFCIFCGSLADLSEEIKKPTKYRTKIRKVSTLEFIGTVKENALNRRDEWGAQVLARIGDTIDLVAAEARYHPICHTKFTKSETSKESTNTRPEYELAAAAFSTICEYISNDDECQHTFNELYDKFQEYCNGEICYTECHFRSKLSETFKDRICFTYQTPKPTIVTYIEPSSHILLDTWHSQKKDNDHDERLRIVEAAANIIREDIRLKIYDTSAYPSENDIRSGSPEQIPESLRLFVENVTKASEKKIIAIEHAIVSAVRPRSFVSSVQIGLGVHLHRNYGSRLMIDLLSNLGMCSSYKEVIRFERAVVRHSGAITLDEHAYVQFVFDNADFNTRTLDGLGTFHSMGGIMCVTPSNAVHVSTAVPRLATQTVNELLGDTKKISPIVYKKPKVSGLKTIVAKAQFSDQEPTTHVVTSKSLVDLLWAIGSTMKEKDTPGWNGFMQKTFSETQTPYQISKVIAVPFITMDPSNPTTINTALIFAATEAQLHGQQFCVVTFDQPLYMKAVDMVLAANEDSPLSKIIPRLGGFHLLMSFMGAVGNIMAGSGLLELWSVIYAKSSAERMQTGHAYARALRAHFLTQLALTSILLEDIQDIEDDVKEISELYQKILQNDESVYNADNSVSLGYVQGRLTELISDYKNQSETSKLWLQYHEQVTLMKMFVRAERTGDWELHLHSVRQMLPFFHAAAHLPYAKAAQIYLQQMENLAELVPAPEFQNLIKDGFFTVRRSDRFWSGNWTDLTIEQVLMRGMKVAGGLVQGRGLTESTLATWIQAMPACIEISEAVEHLSGVSSKTSEQHVELRDSRQSRDKDDTNKLVAWLKDHNPFKRQSKDLVSLFSGMVADESINCQRAKEIGMLSMTSMAGVNFADLKLKRSNKVKTLASMVNGVKIRDEIVDVNSQQLFNRITCVIDSSEDMINYLTYELAPRSPSLFDDVSMRKGTKASLEKHLLSIANEDSEVENNIGTIYIVDGGHLMHKVVWPKPATYKDILELYQSYLISHYGSQVVVVFDGYNTSNSTKVMEQIRRASKNSSVNLEVKENTFVSTTQATFLSNSHNKSQIIDLLRKKLSHSGIKTYQAEEDADRLIVTTAIAEAEKNNIPVTVVAEDTDVLVILLALANTNLNLFFLKPGFKNTPATVVKISFLQKQLGDIKDYLLFTHAVTGCDTTSALYGKGKKAALKLLEANTELRNLLSVFNYPSQSHDDIATAGERFLVSLYGGQETDTLDYCRYYSYNRSVSRLALKSAFELARLPPTSAAARQHSYRVYLQVQKWKGVDLNAEEWGWQKNSNGELRPIVTTLPPAPDNLLELITCACKVSCKRNCECKKAGLVCTAMCARCRGNSCDNAGSISLNDEDEEND